jgi:ribonuclease G
LRWFRSRKSQEQAPSEAAAPEVPEPLSTEPADEAGQSSSTRPRRRRGSRGGRGRSRKTSASEAKTEAPQPKAQAASKAPKTDRKPTGQRRERERPQQRRRREPPRRAPLPEAKRELLVSVDVGEQRVAVLEDDRVAEVYLERPERRSIAGDIYLGTVDNVLPGMEAAFIEIGLEKNGFLYVDEIVTPELEGKARHGKKIQDLISRGQTIMVQAVKDPMKTKGARLTTEISLPGRFVVYQPNGDGFGVSRRLDDEERARLKDVLKGLDLKGGGVIVRTAAEGASAEDIERDLLFLQKLWKSIDARAKKAKPPTLLYQEAELPLRVTRDLFTENFERALVDEDRAYKRIVGYLKKTSPHMVERVVRYKDKPPLMEAYGVDAEIKSTLSRRVDLPSGGYLIFDYAEAFTVIDVNTGRFVGSRSKSSGARLEDTITKNNLEAVKEVVRQLRLRDIGGIIVIDFIDMANPKNRATVEGALRTELERDRTKTYVVEISPLGLVEMTRQNVTDGPREIMTKKCPTCGGDGIVLSETSAAVEVERRLRALAAGSRSQAYRVEVAAKIASILIGPGASRLQELEKQTRRRFYLQGKADTHLDHFLVLAEGKREELAPAAPVAEGAKIELKLVEVGLHDAEAGVGKLDGLDVCVANAAKQVGKKVDVLVERVLDGAAYATLVSGSAAVDAPITAESEAEKPTRRTAPAAATVRTAELDDPEAEEADEEEAEADDAAADGDELGADAPDDRAATAVNGAEPATPKKKTRRGSRGGRGRKKKTAAAASAAGNGAGDAADVATPSVARIHVPGPELGEPEEEPQTEPPGDGAEAAPKPKKKTRRGTRGGRGRKRKTAAAAAATEGSAVSEPEQGETPPSSQGEGQVAAKEETRKPEADEKASDSNEKASDWEYVPMSQWDDV